MKKTVGHVNEYIKKCYINKKNGDYLFFTTHNTMHTIMSADAVQKFIDRYC